MTDVIKETSTQKSEDYKDLETLVNDIRHERSGKKASEMWKEVEKRVKNGETSSLVRKYIPKIKTKVAATLKEVKKEATTESRSQTQS